MGIWVKGLVGIAVCACIVFVALQLQSKDSNVTRQLESPNTASLKVDRQQVTTSSSLTNAKENLISATESSDSENQEDIALKYNTQELAERGLIFTDKGITTKSLTKVERILRTNRVPNYTRNLQNVSEDKRKQLLQRLYQEHFINVAKPEQLTKLSTELGVHHSSLSQLKNLTQQKTKLKSSIAMAEAQSAESQLKKRAPNSDQHLSNHHEKNEQRAELSAALEQLSKRQTMVARQASQVLADHIASQ